jgi:anti-sigma regulatory factor (Ser/Thr protein kinase)
MVAADTLHLSLDAEAESIGIARAAVEDFARGLGFAEPAIGDLKTIVSEACTNVVRHAYPDNGGAFEVEALRGEGELAVVIRDFGQGMQPRVERQSTSLRIGLGLISALSKSFEIAGGEKGGTEVRVRVALPQSVR